MDGSYWFAFLANYFFAILNTWIFMATGQVFGLLIGLACGLVAAWEWVKGHKEREMELEEAPLP